MCDDSRVMRNWQTPNATGVTVFVRESYNQRMEHLISTTEADKRNLEPKPGEVPRKTTAKGAKLWSDEQLVSLPEDVINRREARAQKQRNAGQYDKKW